MREDLVPEPLLLGHVPEDDDAAHEDAVRVPERARVHGDVDGGLVRTARALGINLGD